jgi:hypothetical protein
MTPDEIAVEIYDELQSPSSVSASGISYWLRSNVGKLNNSIFTTFNAPVSGGYGFYQDYPSSGVPMTDKEKDILKCLYELNYYNRQINATMGAAALDSVIEVSSDGATVRRINKNEMSKTWLQLKVSSIQDLNSKIYAYNYGASTPLQVAGDDTIPYSDSTPISYRMNL